MNVRTKFHGSPSNRCGDISLETTLETNIVVVPRKSKGITKFTGSHPLVTMNFCTKFRGKHPRIVEIFQSGLMEVVDRWKSQSICCQSG